MKLRLKRAVPLLLVIVMVLGLGISAHAATELNTTVKGLSVS